MTTKISQPSLLAGAIALACSLGIVGHSQAQTIDPAEINRMAIRLEALEDKMESSSFNGVTLKGSIDPTYIWTSHNKGSFNFADDDSTSSATYENGSFGRVIVDLDKTMDNGTLWSLRLNANKGNKNHIDKAMVLIPMGDGVKLFAGIVPDWSGYEYVDANINKLITHNLHFDYLMPTYYTGAGFEFSSGSFIHKLMFANLNSTHFTKSDQNQSPVLTYRVDWSKGDYSPFSAGYGVGGSTHVGYMNESAQRYDTDNSIWTLAHQKKNFFLFEVDFYRINGAMEYTGEIHLGKVAESAFHTENGRAKNAAWSGVSGQVLYRTSPQMALIARADYIKNSKNGGGVFGSRCIADKNKDGIPDECSGDATNGFGPAKEWVDSDGDGNYAWEVTDSSKGVNRYALSLGLNYTFNANTQFKLELRRDWANGKVFQKTNNVLTNYVRARYLIGAGVVVSF